MPRTTTATISQVKVARINIFGTIVVGRQRTLWKNSKLHASGGWWGGADVVTPNWVPSVFMVGAALGEATFDGLSAQQKRISNAKLMAAAQADPSAFREADSISVSGSYATASPSG